MQISRYRSIQLQTGTAVGRSSLINPVQSVIEPQATSFADVLLHAVNTSPTLGGTYTRSGLAKPSSESGAATQPKQPAATPVKRWSPYSDSGTDLYTQLSAVLGKKSVLIAIA